MQVHGVGRGGFMQAGFMRAVPLEEDPVGTAVAPGGPVVGTTAETITAEAGYPVAAGVATDHASADQPHP